MTMSLFDIEPEKYWETYLDEELKELPLPQFAVKADAFNKVMSIIHNDNNPEDYLVSGEGLYNLSHRQAMIYTSDVVCKPTFGMDYFGQFRVNCMSDDEIAIDDSAGFEGELYPAIEKLGQENILLIRAHGNKGISGGADSRELIRDGVIHNTIDLHNDGTVDEWTAKVLQEVESFLAPSLKPSM